MAKQKFHNKPLLTKEHHKRAVLWSAVGVSVVIVIIGWFANFKTSVALNSEKSGESGLKISSIFQEVSNTFSKGIQDVSQVIGQISNQEQQNTNQQTAEEQQIQELENSIFPEVTNVNASTAEQK